MREPLYPPPPSRLRSLRKRGRTLSSSSKIVPIRHVMRFLPAIRRRVKPRATINHDSSLRRSRIALGPRHPWRDTRISTVSNSEYSISALSPVPERSRTGSSAAVGLLPTWDLERTTSHAELAERVEPRRGALVEGASGSATGATACTASAGAPAPRSSRQARAPFTCTCNARWSCRTVTGAWRLAPVSKVPASFPPFLST